MDDDVGLGIRNWGYYEPSHKGNLGLQLMPSVADRDIKPFLSGRDPANVASGNGSFHHREYGISESSIPMEFVRDGWMHQREKYMHALPGNHSNYSLLSEHSGAQALHMLQPPESSKDDRVARMDEGDSKKDGPLKKRQRTRAPKSAAPKKPRKVAPKEGGNTSGRRANAGNRNTGVVINGIDMDISGIPIPVCSCTGVPQQCYRWGCGGWQSACCTTSISVYPLPMSTKRRGARIAGRKMSQGAFKKVLEKLIADGYNLSNPIDLRTHWAKHGTNKFVTIR
ncbi:hypothetical protein Scep_016255 [Stephania cephalantha]|uniref:GAGA-binding transcriptional activator n=1 Tax=Stephania cephalantha TaxID=152367 RepID=A0AAP0NSF6_9MAGN